MSSQSEKNSEKPGNLENIGRDAALIQLLKSCAAFLSPIPAVVKNQRIVEQFQLFTKDIQSIKWFKLWVTQQIKPNPNKLDEVLESVLNEYGLLADDLNSAQKAKMLKYFAAFDALVDPNYK